MHVGFEVVIPLCLMTDGMSEVACVSKTYAVLHCFISCFGIEKPWEPLQWKRGPDLMPTCCDCMHVLL